MGLTFTTKSMIYLHVIIWMEKQLFDMNSLPGIGYYWVYSLGINLEVNLFICKFDAIKFIIW